VRDEILRIYGEKYVDFGPTLANEKLLENHGIRVSTESVRQILIAGGMYEGRKGRKKRGVYVWR